MGTEEKRRELYKIFFFFFFYYMLSSVLGRFTDNIFFKKINLFIYWLRWAFVAAHGLSPVAARGGPLFVAARAASHCGGLFLLRDTGSRHAGFSSCGSRAPERRLSSRGAQA